MAKKIRKLAWKYDFYMIKWKPLYLTTSDLKYTSVKLRWLSLFIKKKKKLRQSLLWQELFSYLINVVLVVFYSILCADWNTWYWIELKESWVWNLACLMLMFWFNIGTPIQLNCLWLIVIFYSLKVALATLACRIMWTRLPAEMSHDSSHINPYLVYGHA